MVKDRKLLPEMFDDFIEEEHQEIGVDVLNKFFDHYGEPPDMFFLNLERILLPLACKKFEKLAIYTAGAIASEYGASITLLHDGKKDPSQYIPELRRMGVKKNIEVRITKYGDPVRSILEESKNDYDLLVLPSRRRLKLIDKIMLRSISRSILHRIPFHILQVYPPRHGKVPDTISRVGLLLPRTVRDLHLIYWANALLSKKGELLAYHIADIPQITPLRMVMDDDVIQKERENFKILVEGYSKLFTTKITPYFLASHNIIKGIKELIQRTKPDLVFLGQSRKTRRFTIRRSLSENLLDKFNCPMVVHHFPATNE